MACWAIGLLLAAAAIAAGAGGNMSQVACAAAAAAAAAAATASRAQPHCHTRKVALPCSRGADAQVPPSLRPPGGLSPAVTPQFVLLTASCSCPVGGPSLGGGGCPACLSAHARRCHLSKAGRRVRCSLTPCDLRGELLLPARTNGHLYDIHAALCRLVARLAVDPSSIASVHLAWTQTP